MRWHQQGLLETTQPPPRRLQLTPTLEQALAVSEEQRRLLVDDTLIPTWRCAGLAIEANRGPLYSSKHRDHGVKCRA
ncbi:hypothetical protein [Streptomyces luteireticuli]|uniref:hypothetical protein n=1 Tax=Streptomyces luteireticuli TaxID=173858 RepID=UPI0035586FFB